MKIKTITPAECATHRLCSHKSPDLIIDFVPVVKRNVGIGWVQEREAEARDFKTVPVLLRPWLNLENPLEPYAQDH